eukprot:g9263.t1
MRYRSTRAPAADESGCVPSETFSFQEALESGYAPDGGLFVPEGFPRISPDDSGRSELQRWIGLMRKRDLRYEELAFDILRKFIAEAEISSSDLAEICEAAMSGFHRVSQHRSPSEKNPVPVRTTSARKIHVAELFHGPTFCFKDLGQQFTIRLLEHFARQAGAKKLIVVSTTGDTGPAALQAVADASAEPPAGGADHEKPQSCYLSIIVAHPAGQISALQRRQMTTVFSPSVRTVVFEGGGDDLDEAIKKILLKTKYRGKIVGVNSYNIGRPLAQIVHYVWSYLQVVAHEAEVAGNPPLPLVDFAVPTGAMGNLTAGYFAKRMGLPIRFLVTGCNVNDVCFRTFRQQRLAESDASGGLGLSQTTASESRGELQQENEKENMLKSAGCANAKQRGEGEHLEGFFERSPVMLRNLAEAMNIQVPYNFERLLFYAFEETAIAGKMATAAPGDCVRARMLDLERFGRYEIPEKAFAYLQRVFGRSFRISDAEILDTIRAHSRSPDYFLMCPHAACGVRAAERHLDELAWASSETSAPEVVAPVISLATAAWCKFEEVIDQAGVEKPAMSPAVERLMQLPERDYDLQLLAEKQDLWEEELEGLIEQTLSGNSGGA